MTDIEAIRAYLEARGHGAAHSYVGLHSHELAMLRDELAQEGIEARDGRLVSVGASFARGFLAERAAHAAAEAAAEHEAWLASRRAIALEEGRVFEEGSL